MSAVKIITIGEKINLYKNEDLAEKIELVIPNELGFEIVAGKNLYSLGDKAIFIEPDYCLPDSPLFDEFLKPGGDPNKSLLGSVGGEKRRIRAKKFTLSKEPNGSPVYSYGILIPYKVVEDFLGKIKEDSLEKDLGIYKYSEPETINQQSSASSFPSGIYKTDEDNIYNIKGKIQYPIRLIGRLKEDGSSITIGKIDNKDYICSRNQSKSIFIKTKVGERPKTFLEKLMFWRNIDTNIYEDKLSDDTFVKYGFPILKSLPNLYYENTLLRGELSGGSLKGSGNKNNPASKRTSDIRLFGVDLVVGGTAIKQNNDFLEETAKFLNIPLCEKVFDKEFNSFEEIIETCNDYFKTNLVEGIVVRSFDSTFSAKVMNLEYDSKK